jgi:ArsR family metal-binding transcriptional regulator
MSRSWNKAWKNTPQINCGLCGLSTCAAYARAICAGLSPLDACPIILLPEFENQKSELENYMEQTQTAKARTAPDMPEGGILLTRPCKDSSEKVMAEMRVYNGVESGYPMLFSVFDPIILCNLLECLSTRFDLVKCSRDLGYARAEMDDQAITILQDGRINMRRITDRPQVASIFFEIERAILGSVICNCCGADLLSILTGFVNPMSEDHLAFNAGSTFNLNIEVAKQVLTKEKLLSLENDDTTAIANAIDELRDSLIENLNQLISFRLKTEGDYPNVEAVRCLIVNSLSTKKYSGRETYLLKTLAIVRAIDDAILAFHEFRERFKSISLDREEDLLTYLSLAKDGKLGTAKDITPELLLGFAHAARINRAMLLLEKWSG